MDTFLINISTLYSEILWKVKFGGGLLLRAVPSTISYIFLSVINEPLFDEMFQFEKKDKVVNLLSIEKLLKICFFD